MANEDEADRLRRWHQNLANGSATYADVSMRRLRAFSTDMGITSTWIGTASVAEARPVLEDYLAKEKKRGHSGEYIRTTLKAVRSWRLYSGSTAVEGLKVPNANAAPRVENEKMPTQDDLRKLLLAAKPHERVAIVLMSMSGCRPQVIGNYEGTDGLRLSDLPELELGPKSVKFAEIPTMVRIRATSSKAKHGYFTFLGEEGCAAILQYLEQRLRAGEKLAPESDLVHPEKAKKAFVRALNVGDGIRRAMRAAGLDQRPYVWRAYFLSRMLEASNAGKVSDRYVEFWAGHRGDVTAKHYTTGRPRLSTSMVADMRAAYKRAEPFLSTVPAKSDANEGALTVVKAMMAAKGMKESDLEKLDLTGKSFDELVAIFQKLGLGAKPAQRVVPIGEVRELVEAGWEFVSNLGSGDAVLRSPSY